MSTKIRFMLPTSEYDYFAPSAVEGLVGQSVELYGFHGVAGYGDVVSANYIDEQGIEVTVEGPDHLRMFTDQIYSPAELGYETLESDGERATAVNARSLSPAGGPVNISAGLPNGGRVLTDAEVPHRADGGVTVDTSEPAPAGAMMGLPSGEPAAPPAPVEPETVPAGVEPVPEPAPGVTEVAPQPDPGSTDGGSPTSE